MLKQKHIFLFYPIFPVNGFLDSITTNQNRSKTDIKNVTR